MAESRPPTSAGGPFFIFLDDNEPFVTCKELADVQNSWNTIGKIAPVSVLSDVLDSVSFLQFPSIYKFSKRRHLPLLIRTSKWPSSQLGILFTYTSLKKILAKTSVDPFFNKRQQKNLPLPAVDTAHVKWKGETPIAGHISRPARHQTSHPSSSPGRGKLWIRF